MGAMASEDESLKEPLSEDLLEMGFVSIRPNDVELNEESSDSA